MTIDEQVEKRVYNRLRAYDGVEVAGHAPVNSSNGIAPEGQDITISNCTIEGCDSIAIRPRADRCLVTNCSVLSSSNQGINISDASGTGDDVIISNCTVKNTSGTGIFVDGDDCIVIGCRIMNAGNDGINISKNDCIIANNRVSDSTNIDIDNNGTGTVTDGNLTGSAN